MLGMTTYSLNDALDDYDIKRLVNGSARTRQLTNTKLEEWRKWVIKETHPKVLITDIDTTLMSRYHNRFRSRVAPNTFNLYRSLLNGFWKYCVGEGWVLTNPMRHIDNVAVPMEEKTLLSAMELLEMLEEADLARDRVALSTGMNTGLRSQDIAHLKIRHVNLTDNSLTAYIHKTKKIDIMPITAEYRAELLTWFDAYAELMGLASIHDLNNDWTLIPPMRGVAMHGYQGSKLQLKVYNTHSAPHRIVQVALAKRGLPTLREGFHTLRRSAGRIVHDEAVAQGVGNPMRVAMTFLGHKDQKTTEIYLGISYDKQIRDEMMRGQSFLTVAAERGRETNAALDAARNELPTLRRRSA